MCTSIEFIVKVFDFLNSNVNYAVLRNYEGLPHNNLARDIDIIVSKKDFKLVRKQFLDLIYNSECKIISYYKIERESFICACNDNGDFKIIQFDFLFNCEVKGLLLIDADTILDKRIFNGSIYHVCQEHEYLAKFLYNKLLNHPYPKKYAPLKSLVGESTYVKDQIEQIFKISFDKFSKYSGTRLFRRRLLFNLMFCPFKQIVNIMRIILYKLRHNFYYSGISMGLTGPDGSGKTTVINQVEQIFKQVFKTEVFHFRPSFLSNIGAVANNIGLKKHIDIDYSKPHRGSKVGLFNSSLRLLYYSVDYIIGYYIRTHKLLKKSQIIFFDRYYTDIIADSQRSRIFLNHKFLYWFGKLFIPKMDYNILLTADKEVILERKQELDAEGIIRINKKLNYLSNNKGYSLVLNNGEAEEAVRKILNIVFEGQHQKNLKHLNR